MYDATDYQIYQLEGELRRAGVPREFFNLDMYIGLTYPELADMVRTVIRRYIQKKEAVK